MAFYFRPDDIPELQGLTSREQRALLRGTFMKERLLSSVVLMLVVLGGFYCVVEPLLHKLVPTLDNGSLPYMGILMVWLFALIWLREAIMMNLLRKKIAAYRARLAAGGAAGVAGK